MVSRRTARYPAVEPRSAQYVVAMLPNALLRQERGVALKPSRVMRRAKMSRNQTPCPCSQYLPVHRGRCAQGSVLQRGVRKQRGARCGVRGQRSVCACRWWCTGVVVARVVVVGRWHARYRRLILCFPRQHVARNVLPASRQHVQRLW